MLKPVAALILASIAMFVVPSFAQAACPVINGKYVKETTIDGKPKRYVVLLFTRVERGVFSYTVTKDASSFQVADSVWRPVRLGEQDGQVKVYCSGSKTVNLDYKAGDETAFAKVTPIDEGQMQYESSDMERNGIYVKL